MNKFFNVVICISGLSFGALIYAELISENTLHLARTVFNYSTAVLVYALIFEKEKTA